MSSALKNESIRLIPTVVLNKWGWYLSSCHCNENKKWNELTNSTYQRTVLVMNRNEILYSLLFQEVAQHRWTPRSDCHFTELWPGQARWINLHLQPIQWHKRLMWLGAFNQIHLQKGRLHWDNPELLKWSTALQNYDAFNCIFVGHRHAQLSTYWQTVHSQWLLHLLQIQGEKCIWVTDCAIGILHIWFFFWFLKKYCLLLIFTIFIKKYARTCLN